MTQHLCLNQNRNETSGKNKQINEINQQLHKQILHQSKSTKKNQQSLLSKIQKNRLSLNSKDQVKSLHEQESDHSQQMDIDEQNDIVNELSFIQTFKKDDQQNQLMTNFQIKDLILHANSKKHQGNQFFKENNFQSAIQSYKIGLNLLKPQRFSQACQSDYLLMAQLTSNILYNMGTCYFILMSFKHAIKYYDQAILIKPNYAKAIHNRALSHFQEGNISKAYEDIKLVNKIDKQNICIQKDFKRIQYQYFQIFTSQKEHKQKIIYVQDEEKQLSKSMVQPDKKNNPLKQTSLSMISYKKENFQTQLKPRFKNSKECSKQTQNQQFLRKRVQNLYRKRSGLNYIKSLKNSNKKKHQKSQNGQQNKFRPYVWNGSNNFLFIQQRNQKNQRFIQQSSNKISKRRVKTENSETQKNQKDRQKYWGYIPIAVATGFGIYHGIRAVLGK